tara:strand:+ start:99 stop:1094 length:996 start_codon:yes stop_codon:yes gene_type:complete
MSTIKANRLANTSDETVMQMQPDGITPLFPAAYNPGGFPLPTWADNTGRPASPLEKTAGYNIDKKRIEFYSGLSDRGKQQWYRYNTSVSLGGVNTYNDMNNLNGSLGSYGYNDVSQVRQEFENYGYKLIGTPCYGGMAESMNGTTSAITSRGYFARNEFDSGTQIRLSDGMPDSALNGYPHMIFAGYDGSTYRGIAFMAYRDYSSPTALKSFFYPNQTRNLYCFVLNADGSTRTDTSGNTSTWFSDNQNPNSNGYYQNNRFAQDDGSWGFCIGAQSLNGNWSGPHLSNNQANSYGTENRNSGDTCCPQMYWGPQSNTSTTSFTFFFAVKYN